MSSYSNMYGFICRRLVLSQDLAKTQLGFRSSLGFVINERSLAFPISSIRLLLFSTESEQHSFVVSYLINSCGLSPETAKSVSTKVNFQSADRPDSVLKILRNHGFTNTHIAKLVQIRPRLLLADPERSVLPKLEFFKSIGVTDAQLARVCSINPTILMSGLENVLIPNYNFLKSLLLSDENVVKVFKLGSWIFQQDSQKKVSQKLAALRELGVPESFVPSILTCYLRVVLQSSEKFDENVRKVINMGFDPQKFGFILAVQVFASSCQSTLERKFDVFRRWGWSEDDILSAFRKSPNFISTTENKITNGMDFLVNKIGWQPSAIALYPAAFLLNLENRVIPRCLVIKFLQSKGLVKRTMSLGTFLKPSEKQFLDRYVTKHVDIVPQLLNIYRRKEGLEFPNTQQL